MRGLASMSQEQRRAIQSMGGRSAHAMGRAHRWTSEEAARAGKIGNRIRKRKQQTRQYAAGTMRAIQLTQVDTMVSGTGYEGYGTFGSHNQKVVSNSRR